MYDKITQALGLLKCCSRTDYRRCFLSLFTALIFLGNTYAQTEENAKNHNSVPERNEGKSPVKESASNSLGERINLLSPTVSDFYEKKQILDKKEETIKIKKQKLKQLEISISRLSKESKAEEESVKEIKTKKESKKSEIEKAINSLSGEFSFKYLGKDYFAFVADLGSHEIDMHLKAPSADGQENSKYISLGKVKQALETKGKEVLMLTNGGMYTPKNDPEGLLIINKKEIEPINLRSSKKTLNFYLKPNGIFMIDNGIPRIMETNKFYKLYREHELLPTCATQSGPMLVIDGKIHPKLNHGSTSRKLRSAVGVMDNHKIVFIISANGSTTNFHDFSTIFLDVFGCQNALFLDGAISKMYLEKSNKDLGGNFGPIISVVKK
tara:strand:- start:64 stop:1209 length:1146 start_codon:yes stop_codon:yes gene_type:complete